VAPLGTALTEDQLHLLWRTAPEPIMAFDGDAAGLNAAHRAARLALPHLKAGHSLRFAFMPSGEDPDSFLRANDPAAMKLILDEALPLSQVLWKAETEGKDFSTPERRAGLERARAEITSAIGDGKVADYYRREFDQKVFDNFKRRAPAAQPRQGGAFNPRFPRERGIGLGQPPAFAPPVSADTKASLLNRSPRSGLLRMREEELIRLLLAEPELAIRHIEVLAELPLSDASLDRLRHELLNLAASKASLEKQGVEDHLKRLGLGEILARLTAGAANGAGFAQTEDLDTSFLTAAGELRAVVARFEKQGSKEGRLAAEGGEARWNDYLRHRAPGSRD
jgi:DNA primase